jgi:hypothetical protein
VNERRFELLGFAIDELKDKLAGGTPMTCGTEVTDAVHGSPTPPSSANLDNIARIGNMSCNCNFNSCTVVCEWSCDV